MTTKEKISTIPEFISWIEDLKTTSGEVLYRGLSSDGYDWDSSIARRIKEKKTRKKLSIENIWKETSILIEGAKKQGYDRDPTRRGETPTTDFEILAILQHHNAATPLMDFSHNPLIALWFACQRYPNKSEPDKDGRIIAIDLNNFQKSPREINIKIDSITPKGIKRKRAEIEIGTPLIDYKEGILNTTNHLWKFNPPGFDARILAQNSEFILGKTELNEGDIINRPCIILESAKSDIQRQLKLYGISEERLFRDFSGYARINSQESPIKDVDSKKPVKQSKNIPSATRTQKKKAPLPAAKKP